MRKFIFNLIVNLILSFAVAFAVTIATLSYSTTPFSATAILMPWGFGTLIGTVVTLVIPVNSLGMKFAAFNGAKPGTPMCAILKNFVILAIMIPVMNFCISGIILGALFTPDFFVSWLYPICAVYPAGYVASLLFEPIAVTAATKLTGFNPMAALVSTSE